MRETGEGCVFAPSFGAYQGEGGLSAGTCAYADTAVQGVELYGFERIAAQ
jgi:hypothetical protein